MRRVGSFLTRLQPVLIFEPIIILEGEDIDICEGETFTLAVDGADDIRWRDASALSCDDCPNPSGVIDQTTTFTAYATGCAGQEVTLDITVNVIAEVDLAIVTPDTSVSLGSSITLEAEISDPFTPITWYDELGNQLCENCSSIEVSPQESTTYYAEANYESGCVVRDEIRLDILDSCAEGSITVPNYITPNGDGQNDDIQVRYEDVQSVNKMRIFNRWGQLVFKTDDVDNERWNGMVDGVVANAGVYVYFIEYQCLNGNTVFQKGNITVIK